MMDLKEIIKWFIPCFHILLANLKHFRFTFICLFLLLNCRVGCAANVKSVEIVDTKNISLYENRLNVSLSDVREVQSREFPDILKQIQTYFAPDGSVGRTFGRPFKKMVGALMPLIFQVGAASTWAVVAALVGIKTLAVTLLILKILLVAGAAKILAVAEIQYLESRKKEALHSLPTMTPWYYYIKLNGTTNGTFGTTNKTNKGSTNGTTVVKNRKKRIPESFFMQKIGALFGSKAHGHQQYQAWEPPHHPQKEIHLHIHNGHHDVAHDDHGPPVYGGWSRDDGSNVIDLKQTANPYPIVGPQTIRTPFGNYIKVEDAHPTG